MYEPPLRLAFGAVFWRIFLLTFSIQQFTAFNKTRHVMRHAHWDRRLAAFLDFTPYAVVLGLFAASIAAVALDLLLRLVARPLAARWYEPRGTGREATPLGFQIGPSERVRGEWPARRRVRRGWQRGTLVLTDQRLCFYPVDWDLEPWEIAPAAIDTVRRKPARALLGSFVLGLPDTLAVRVEGRDAHFALAEPAMVVQAIRAATSTRSRTPQRRRS